MSEELKSDQFRSLAEAPDVSSLLETKAPQEGDNPRTLWAKMAAAASLAAGVQPTTAVMSAALEASKVLKATAGKLHELSVFNSSASAQFILIMDSAAVPADGAVTLLYPPIPIAAGALVRIEFTRPRSASTGICVCNSSTGSFTKTLGSADCVFEALVTD